MSKYKKLGKNTALMFLSNFGSKIVTFIMLPYYTSKLTQEEYGSIDLMNTVLLFIMPLLTFQIVDALFRLPMGKTADEKSEYFSSAIFMVVTSSFLFLLISPLIRRNPIIREYYFYLLAIFLISYLKNIMKEFLRVIGRVDLYMQSEILYTFTFTLLNILLIPKLAIRAYFISIIASNFLTIGNSFLRGGLYKYLLVNKIKKKILKEMIFYSLPLMPTAIMWWIMNLSDRLLISHYKGLEELANYSVANKFPVLITTLWSIFYKAWQISAIEEYGSEEYENLYNNIFSLLSVILISGSLFITISIKHFLPILVKGSYLDSWKYIPILTLSSVFSAISGYLGVTYTVKKNTKWILLTTLLGAFINISLNIILIPSFGNIGAASATLLAFLAVFIFRLLQTRKDVKVYLSILFRRIVQILLITIIYISLYKSLIHKNVVMIISIFIFYLLEKDLIIDIFVGFKHKNLRFKGVE